MEIDCGEIDTEGEIADSLGLIFDCYFFSLYWLIVLHSALYFLSYVTISADVCFIALHPEACCVSLAGALLC